MTAAAVGGRAAPRGLLLLAAVAAACVARVNADEYTHKYVVGDAVRLWVNKVGARSARACPWAVCGQVRRATTTAGGGAG